MGRGMYSVANRPSKIVANARIGAPKSLNNLEKRDLDKLQSPLGMNSPRPVFNGQQRLRSMHNRHNNHPHQHHHQHHHQHQQQQQQQQQQPPSPQHDEYVKYLSDGWGKVNNELDMHMRNQKEGGPVVYKEKNPNPNLSDFKPFDLENFWRDQYLQRITGSS